MAAFYNRHPWNLVIGLSIAFVALVAVAAGISWWLLIVPPVVYIASHLWSRIRRAYALSSVGYSIRIGRGSSLIYEERSGRTTQALQLRLENTEPGHFELFVPAQPEWVRLVPDWARERRMEIAKRIGASWRSQDVHVAE